MTDIFYIYHHAAYQHRHRAFVEDLFGPVTGIPFDRLPNRNLWFKAVLIWPFQPNEEELKRASLCFKEVSNIILPIEDPAL